MAPNLEVVIGTYEQFVLGYTVDDVVNKYKMEQSFATHSHLASIRSLASSKHYLASAAADDTVCLYDMHSRTENGKLVHHTDTVNSISFTPDASHIITVSSDGTIGIVRCGSWQVEKHWLKPHKGFGVETLAVHPTGKLAMTTGRDGVLRTWNLVKGRQAYATNLVPRWKIDAKNINVLKWSPNGESYLLAANNRIDIYSVESAGIEEEFSFESRVVCAEYLDNECIAIGLDNGKINIYNLETKSKSNEIQAHDARVKCLAVSEELLVSASSSGEIKLWSFKDDELKMLNTVDCNARISCLTLTSHLNLKCNKKEVDVEEEVPKIISNKLRLKQQVIIEDEETEENKTAVSKKKRNKKSRKLIDNPNEDTENIFSVKKVKANLNKPSISMKHKNDESELPIENLKKKKLSNTQKKRKNSEKVMEDDDSTENFIENKKQKSEISKEINETKSNQINMNKKKRKNADKVRDENLQKKQKFAQSKLMKKKKKMNFKHKKS